MRTSALLTHWPRVALAPTVRSTEAPRHPQAETCAACPVRPDALFGVLDDDALARIHVVVARQHLKHGEPLFLQGQTGAAVFTIHRGIVRLERNDPHGDRRILRLAGPGDLIGLEALVRQAHGNDAVACTELEVCRIPRTVVDELSAPFSPLTAELMRRWHGALKDAEDWTVQMGTGTALRRMVAVVRWLSRYAGSDHRIWLPRREELGAMLNMTLETASRQVSLLRRAGVLNELGPRDARVCPERLDALWSQACRA